MMLLVKWVLSAIAIMITTYLLRGIHVDSFAAALVAAMVLGVINVTLKPLLFVLTFPITIMTLGIFAIVLNAILILLTAVLVPGFSIDSFWWAILFSVVLAVVNYFLNTLIE